MERFSLVGERLKCSSHPLINQVALASKSCMGIGSTHKDQFCEQVTPFSYPHPCKRTGPTDLCWSIRGAHTPARYLCHHRVRGAPDMVTDR